METGCSTGGRLENAQPRGIRQPAYAAGCARNFKSRVCPAPNSDSSTVASMMARLSSRSVAGVGLDGPVQLHQEPVVAEAEGEAEPALVLQRPGFVDEVVRRLGDGELEVRHLLGGERGQPADRRQGKASQDEVVGPRRNGERYVAALGRRRSLHSMVTLPGNAPNPSLGSAQCPTPAARPSGARARPPPCGGRRRGGSSSFTLSPAPSAPTRSARSFAGVRRRPFTDRITSPPVGIWGWPWKVMLSSPPWMPASSAGLAGSTSSTSAAPTASRSSRSASCGQMANDETPR